MLRLIVLLLLTRDGVLHRLADGPGKGQPTGVSGARTLARFADGRLAVLHGRGIRVLADDRPPSAKKPPRELPGAAADLRDLQACGAHLAAVTEGNDVVEIDLQSGARRTLAHWPKSSLVACDGEVLLAAHDKTVSVVPLGEKPPGGQPGGKPPEWTLAHTPIALAAAGGRVFVATHEGPLYQIDRATGRTRDLDLGGWFNTLGLAATDDRLYAVTTSGKVWEIDFTAQPHPTKTALAIDGWQSTIGLAVSR